VALGAKTSDPAWKTTVRPVLGRASEREGMRLVMTIATSLKDADYRAVRLGNLRVSIHTPGGQSHELRAATDPKKLWIRQLWLEAIDLAIDEGHLWFDLYPAQVRPRLRRRPKNVRWVKPLAPGTLSQPGTYLLRLSGTINILVPRKLSIPFSTAVVPIHIERASPKFRSVDELRKLATEALTRRRATKGKKPVRLASYGMVVDTRDGTRVVRFVGNGIPGMGFHNDILVRIQPDGRVTGFDSWGYGCIARGTPIATPSGPRPIEALAPGDRVYGYQPRSGQRVIRRVTANRRAGEAATFELVPGLRLTAEHPVLVGGAWRPAAYVKRGERLLGSDLVRRSATPGASTRRLPVHDLTVEAPHNYFAAGVLVHNKTGATPRWSRLFGGVDR
jgi:hypothetical protein